MALSTRKRIGLMLSTPPEHPNLGTVVGLTRAALESGNEVYLYLIDEGTRALIDPRLKDLKSQGLKLYICAYGGQRHGIEPDDQAVFCGLVVLSDLIKGSDRFLSFN